MANYLTLGVAGSGKTRRLVDQCGALPRDKRALLVTYTQTNQAELRNRLAKQIETRQSVEVVGWFTFLLREFARPFLPFKFSGQRVRGFNFEGRPYRYASGVRRFLDLNGAVYSCELGRLAHELVEASGGALLHRLECCYDAILVDEVQDLSAHDWEIIDVLLESSVEIWMVGDMRQAVLATNQRSRKNKQYAYSEAIKWFREREDSGALVIKEDPTTWRCCSKVAEFADAIFDKSWSFPETKSRNETTTEHDGVFLIRSEHVAEYAEQYRPQCLRDNVRSGKGFNLDFVNFGLAKGTEHERVLIVPTAGIAQYIRSGDALDPVPAARFYVAVTRAAQSVAIVMDDPGNSELPYWSPEAYS